MLVEQIRRNVEPYIDDIIVKSEKAKEHIDNLKEVCNVLRKSKVKLNIERCVFEVGKGKFLSFMVS